MIYEAIGGVTLFVVMACVSIWQYGRLCRDSGYEEGRADAYGETPDPIEEQPAEEEPARELAAGRHARTEPRQQPAATFTARSDPDQQPPWYTQIPGPGHPQPGRDSGPGTARLPRYGSIAYALEAAGVRPRLGLPATTGEIAAINDQVIADGQAQAAADRAAVVAAFREPLPSEQEAAEGLVS